MYDLTGFQRDLLFVVAGQSEPAGVAIKDEIEEYYREKVNYGQLYPNLNTLMKKGLVEKGKKDGRTNTYLVTNRWHRELQARLDWERQYTA
ncbi:helix-turn-helix transcriptional regulator [Haloarcula rubripromontorii]|uniref:PadR family transcriptional regulator n=1 Tax=Haloarcula rubripromontorii TaxID=1705562 RepID=A0A0N0U8N4_9EURY|nr:helix-turn-helix transcriptional regulator [Haloarcula rubripromontorii]KOX91484.1 PadR family transcriptional regulator [Haloarcula rubripromontorii]